MTSGAPRSITTTSPFARAGRAVRSTRRSRARRSSETIVDVALETREQVVEADRRVVDDDHLVLGLGGSAGERLEAAQGLFRTALEVDDDRSLHEVPFGGFGSAA